MHRLRYLYGVIALLLLPIGMQAQMFNDTIDRSAEDFVKAYLVVVEPGGALYSVYGHSCLHLVCKAYGMDYYFSYESEDAENKILTFLSGNLKMGMARLSAEEYIGPFKDEGRGLNEYEILLPLKFKKELWRVLDEHVDEGMYLPYDFESRGCAYACHVILKEALGKTPIQYGEWDEHFDLTRREILHNYSYERYPWNTALIHIIVGSKGDAQLPKDEKLVLPTDLAVMWQQATVAGSQILSKEPINVSPSKGRQQHSWCTPLFVSLMLLLLSVAGLFASMLQWKGLKAASVVVDYVVLAVQTAIGALVTYLVVFSTLPCTEWNWLIIPFNIMPLLCWYWRKYWALPYSIVIGAWIIGITVIR